MSNDTIKYIGDTLSISTVIATLAQWLPPVAALVTIIWTTIRIWETKTVQKLFHKGKRDRRALQRHDDPESQ